MQLCKILAVVATLTLCSCTTLDTNVSAYSKIPADLQPKTVQIVPLVPEDGKSLEWQTVASKLATSLTEKGYTVVASRKQARLTAGLGFLIDGGERVASSYSIPQYGVTGYSGATTSGTVVGNYYSATTTYTPTYGVTGYSSGTRVDTIFTRGTMLLIQDNNTRQTVFEAKATSQGDCGNIALVAPVMIEAILSEFPAGKIGTVTEIVDWEC
ncbi:DUF4136 domain-containing protein [Falsirhodobacter xinxiangensis]|uniref:DUF4136 domain-containing protein n=1 Tax=Falsirhodobacter xinxiangensis TaxID=2530049 RepID=UPI0010AA9A1C|nr:DUF4136 domain-containing protein [Rhodobacter xinxiangensis]